MKSLLPIICLAASVASAQEKLLDRFAPKPVPPAADGRATTPAVEPVAPVPDDGGPGA